MLKHTEEKNKLALEVERNEKLWASKSTVFKNIDRAKLRGTKDQKRFNPLRESMYMILIQSVKQLYLTLPNQKDRIVVEIPLKKHPLDSEGIHSFMTPHFFAQLECDILNNYCMFYKFHNCPFEQEIWAMMKRSSLSKVSKEAASITNYQNYFKRVLQCQPERFIYML